MVLSITMCFFSNGQNKYKQKNTWETAPFFPENMKYFNIISIIMATMDLSCRKAHLHTKHLSNLVSDILFIKGLARRISVLIVAGDQHIFISIEIFNCWADLPVLFSSLLFSAVCLCPHIWASYLFFFFFDCQWYNFPTKCRGSKTFVVIYTAIYILYENCFYGYILTLKVKTVMNVFFYCVAIEQSYH